jgi:hypothetical protein
MTQAYGFTVPYSKFLPLVLQYVPDASDFIAENAIKQAAIEFCEKTLVWQINIPAMDVVNGQNSYPVQTPADTKFVVPVQAYFNTNLLIPKGPDELAEIYRMGDYQQIQGAPQYITRMIKPEVMLVPTPYVTQPAILYVKAAIAPTRDSSEIDSEIYEQYAEAIAWGARGRLLAQPRQDYSDKAGAIEALKMFRYEINRVRMQVTKGLTRGSPRIEFQRWV